VKSQQEIGGGIIKGGIIRETTIFLALRLNIVKSNSNNVTNLLIATAYFPDSGREKSQYEEMRDKLREFVAKADRNDFVVIGANTNASIGTRNSRGEKLDDTAPDY
jgi:hypothetical protein